MNTSTIDQIDQFAADVRAALADLPADEVEELTEGLEADLAEALAEDLARELPNATDYADELRLAAGLPKSQPAKGRLAAIAAEFSSGIGDFEARLRRSPATSASLDFIASLQPAWWVVRGWAAYQTFQLAFGHGGADLLPHEAKGWALLALMIGGSIFIGKRIWPKWLQVPIWFGNAFAVLMTFVALGALPSNFEMARAFDSSGQGGYSDGSTGVLLDGHEVTNIFAYDKDGQKLANVQLFDQDGNPLSTSAPDNSGCLTFEPETDDCQTPGVWVSTTLETGAQAWNVYPLSMVESSPVDPSMPLPEAKAQERTAPFIKVPAVLLAPQQPATADQVATDPAANGGDSQ